MSSSKRSMPAAGKRDWSPGTETDRSDGEVDGAAGVTGNTGATRTTTKRRKRARRKGKNAPRATDIAVDTRDGDLSGDYACDREDGNDESYLDDLDLDHRQNERAKGMFPIGILRDRSQSKSDLSQWCKNYFVQKVLSDFENRIWPPELTGPNEVAKAIEALKSKPYLGTSLHNLVEGFDRVREGTKSNQPLDEAVKLPRKDECEVLAVLPNRLEGTKPKQPHDQSIGLLSENDLTLLGQFPAECQELVKNMLLTNAMQLREKDVQLGEKDVQLGEKDVQLREKDVQLREKDLRFECYRVIQSVTKATVEVQVQLRTMSGLSQAEGTLTQTTSTCSRTLQSQTEALMKRLELPYAQAQDVYSTVIDKSKELQEVLPDLLQSSSCEKENGAEERLLSLSKIMENFYKTSTFLLASAENYKEKVADGIKCLHSMIGNRDISSSFKEGPFVPGPMSHEKDGTQPFFQYLFQIIGEVKEMKDFHPSTPPKHFIRTEAPIPATARRHKRFVDLLLHKERRWDPIIFDDTLTVPVEVKPGCRGHSGPMTLLSEGRDQVLSHLAKYIFIGFNFAHYGVPCHATGIVGNMAAVQVLQLRYENCGTVDAKLVLYQSDLLPLLSKRNFIRWKRKAKKDKEKVKGKIKEEFDELQKQLFSSEKPCGISDTNVPLGMRLIYNLMGQPSKKLYGLSIETNSKALGEELGTGATAVVFRRRGADAENLPDSVVKISRYGFKTDIENELAILRRLAVGTEMNDPGCPHIPTVVEYNSATKNGSLEITMGCVPVKLPAIETSPAGIKATSFIHQGGKLEEKLHLILNGIDSALEYMHHRMIFHCDVAPQNIIVANTDNQMRAVLIDYSMATEVSSSLNPFKGFRGTPNYVHRGIYQSALSSKAWGPRKEHDKAGLAFSLSFFANGCVRPWNIVGYPKCGSSNQIYLEGLESEMKNRYRVANAIINDLSSGELQDKMRRLLAYDMEIDDRMV